MTHLNNFSFNPDNFFSYMGKENPTRKSKLGNLIQIWLSGTVDCWHCLMTLFMLLFMTSQHIPLHYVATTFNGIECYKFEQFHFKIHSISEK